MNDIEICFRNACTTHGEELVHALDGHFVPNHALMWPDPADDSSGQRSRDPIIGKIDGVVVARAFLEAELYPFAELQNLYVAEGHRGRGIGSSIVADSIRRASELGYLAIHVQTDLGNTAAQRLYAQHGFIPAHQGQMLRMIRFINFPLLSSFLSAHPLIRFDSRANGFGERLWILEWSSLINADSLTLILSGGSCQADSGGYALGVVGVELRAADAAFEVNIDGTDEAFVNNEVSLTLQINNTSITHLEGVVRLLLNSGFAPGSGAHEARPFRVAPGSAGTIDLPVMALDTFRMDFWKYSAYESVAVGVELVLGHSSLWLTKQMKIRTV